MIKDRILKTFRRRPGAEMVTSHDVSKTPANEPALETSPAQVPAPDTLGQYNIFGLRLTDATALNDSEGGLYDPRPAWSDSSYNFDYRRHVPAALAKCLEYINAHGLDEEGLYRVSGSAPDVQALRTAIAEDGPAFSVPAHTDVHAVTSLVKAFCRELPEELLPVMTRHTFLAYAPAEIPTEFAFANGGVANYSLFTAEEEDMNPNVIPTQILQEILHELEPCNFALVYLLTSHLRLVADNSKSNKMTVSNLGMILCQTLRIHKSVFHALILKGPAVWADIHPHGAVLETRAIKYDTSRILSYQQQQKTQQESWLSSRPTALASASAAAAAAASHRHASSVASSTLFSTSSFDDAEPTDYFSADDTTKHFSMVSSGKLSPSFESREDEEADFSDHSSCDSLESMSTTSQHCFSPSITSVSMSSYSLASAEPSPTMAVEYNLGGDSPAMLFPKSSHSRLPEHKGFGALTAPVPVSISSNPLLHDFGLGGARSTENMHSAFRLRPPPGGAHRDRLGLARKRFSVSTSTLLSDERFAM